MAEATLRILLYEQNARIHPHLYGHFMEHLGQCIDEGCWVGLDAEMAHTGGVRDDVVAALKAVRAPVIRWPGGCFADDYHWQDGIGPPETRPRRINIHWGDVIETNAFGTHEFMAFCRAVGAEPYFCGNVGSGTPRELRDWVEYCNFPGDSSLARQRAANGADTPLGVRYWGVGNENWGCGGNFTPEDYCGEYRRFATYLRNWGDEPLFLIACGPNGNDAEWTRRFFTKLTKDYGHRAPLHGFAAHYYCGTAGTATEYTEAQWHELLYKATLMEPLIVQQRALMDAFDPQRKIGLIVDEWGTWHPPTPGRNPSFLWQQNTVRDALVAALTLDIFNRHADKVVMANLAQTINVLQALLLTEGDKLLKTPTYYVYQLYAPHQGGQSVRMLCDSPNIACTAGGKTGELPMLSGSASLRDGVLTVTCVNASATESVETALELHGHDTPKEMHLAVLDYEDKNLHAHNTFENPNAVTLWAQPGGAPPPQKGRRYVFPPASVTRLSFVL